MSNKFGYADLIKDLHQAADEYDRGHGPLHALAANAIEHLTTLIHSAPSAALDPGTVEACAKAIEEMEFPAPRKNHRYQYDVKYKMVAAIRALMGQPSGSASSRVTSTSRVSCHDHPTRRCTPDDCCNPVSLHHAAGAEK